MSRPRLKKSATVSILRCPNDAHSEEGVEKMENLKNNCGNLIAEGTNLIVINKSFIEELTSKIQELTERVIELSSPRNPLIYTNKTVKDLLGVQDKLLKKYRDDGLLGYHQVGDKYWYTREDIITFLANTQQEAYAFAS